MSAFSDFWNDLLRLTHYEHTTTHPATDCRASSGAFYERNAAVSDVRIFGPRRPASEDVRRQEDARRWSGERRSNSSGREGICQLAEDSPAVCRCSVHRRRGYYGGNGAVWRIAAVIQRSV